MSRTEGDREDLATAMIAEAAAWASNQPWPLTADQVCHGRPKPWLRRRWTIDLPVLVPSASRRRPRRARLALVVVGLIVAAVVALPVVLVAGTGRAPDVRLQLTSYSLRLPSGYHLTRYQSLVCLLTTQLLAARPGGGVTGSGGPRRIVAADTSSGNCLVMAFVKPSGGVPTAPARVLGNDRPVRVGRYSGLIGSTSTRGDYGCGGGGCGPLGNAPHGFSETLVALTLAVPLAGHLQTLEIVEHGLREKTFLSIVSSGLAADVALSPTAR
jgi:hypothetical protein